MAFTGNPLREQWLDLHIDRETEVLCNPEENFSQQPRVGKLSYYVYELMAGGNYRL